MTKHTFVREGDILNIGYNPHLGYEADVVHDYQRMVHKIANKYRVALNAGLDYDDLISIGTLGLIEAFRNYDPDRFRGKVNSFATYAYPMIQWNIQRFVRDKRHLVRLPRALQSKMTIIRNRGWANESAEFISESAGWKLAETREVLRLMEGWSISSVDQPLGNEEISLLDTLPGSADFTGVHVKEFISFLDQRERAVLEMRLSDKTQGQIAQSIGITQVHVSRILKQIGSKFIQYQAGTLKREGIQMSRGRGSQPVLNANIEWFVDEAIPTTPTVGLNNQGIHLNKRAVHEMGCKPGQCLQVGYDPEGQRLVMQVSSKGLQLRAVSGDKTGGLRVVNKRLSAWLSQKQLTPKRYALKADTSADLFYIQLEQLA